MENYIENLKALKLELETLANDWDKNHNTLDANWVGVRMSSKKWRMAKKLGLKKDGYYGYLLLSKSVNSCGSDFAHEVSQICSKYDVWTSISEYQL